MLACYRRVLMKKMKKFKDWDFILWVCALVGKFILIPEVLFFFYRQTQFFSAHASMLTKTHETLKACIQIAMYCPLWRNGYLFLNTIDLRNIISKLEVKLIIK
jgi:hypothetical protein